jgi:hypothetical protein
MCKLLLVMLSKTEVQQQQGIRKAFLLPYTEHVYVTVSTVYYPRSRVRTRPKPSDFSGEKVHSTPSCGGDLSRLSDVADLLHVKDPCDLRGSLNRRPN